MSDSNLRRFAKDLAYELTVNTAYQLFKKDGNNNLQKESYKKPKSKKKRRKVSCDRNLESVFLPNTLKPKD